MNMRTLARASAAFYAVVLVAVVAVVMTTSPASVRASGLELREQGAAALGRSDAVTARFDHPSTAYFNPAGMAFLEGLQLSIGVTAVFPVFSYSDPDGYYDSVGNKTPPVTPPHVYATWQINDMFAVGLAVNIPFGLGVRWPSDFPGASIAVDSMMRIFLINPSISIKPLENLSIAVGLQLMPGTVEIKRNLGFVTEGGMLRRGGVDLGAMGFGVGGNLGIMYRPLDWLYLGFSYRSRVKMVFDGDAHFRVPEDMHDRSIFHDQKASATATFPDLMVFGIGFQVLEELYIEADLDYVLWSTVDKLTIDFPDDASGQLTDPIREDWHDGWTPRLSIEWRALDVENHELFVRFGGGYDTAPAPDHTLSPLLPDSQRVYGSTGLGYTYRPWRLSFDFGFMFSKFLKRSVDETNCEDGYCNPFPATYDSHVYLVSFDVNWRVF